MIRLLRDILPTQDIIGKHLILIWANLHFITRDIAGYALLHKVSFERYSHDVSHVVSVLSFMSYHHPDSNNLHKNADQSHLNIHF